MLALCPEHPLARPKSKIYTPKRDDKHPRLFQRWVPCPRPNFRFITLSQFHQPTWYQVKVLSGSINANIAFHATLCAPSVLKRCFLLVTCGKLWIPWTFWLVFPCSTSEIRVVLFKWCRRWVAFGGTKTTWVLHAHLIAKGLNLTIYTSLCSYQLPSSSQVAKVTGCQLKGKTLWAKNGRLTGDSWAIKLDSFCTGM